MGSRDGLRSPALSAGKCNGRCAATTSGAVGGSGSGQVVRVRGYTSAVAVAEHDGDLLVIINNYLVRSLDDTQPPPAGYATVALIAYEPLARLAIDDVAMSGAFQRRRSDLLDVGKHAIAEGLAVVEAVEITGRERSVGGSDDHDLAAGPTLHRESLERSESEHDRRDLLAQSDLHAPKCSQLERKGRRKRGPDVTCKNMHTFLLQGMGVDLKSYMFDDCRASALSRTPITLRAPF